MAVATACLLASLFVPPRLEAPMAWTGFGLLVVGAMVTLVVDGSRLEARKIVKAGTKRDAEQEKWSYSVLLMGLFSLPLCVLSSRDLWTFANGLGEPRLSAMALGPLATGMAFVFIWKGLEKGAHAQRWLDDELMRAYRASAMAWGFVAAFVAMCVVFGLMLWQVPVAVAAMPFAMWLTVSTAGVRLWWQVRDAERG
ncbi:MULTISPECIES: hypothetical protein [unclassified Brevundimonas]|uniref:hypothetical protein n=1 Tax=unclassified Brevundimonas TaxID=2622653 RepID=UPI0025C649F6|nr:MULTISPECIES: hypothetical protein [unclassified Brevundimonas]